MTNSEAAKCIEHIRFYMEGGECWTDAEFEAMDMAIEALRSATDINVATSKYTVSATAVEEMLKDLLPERGMWEIEGDEAKNAICETVHDALEGLWKLPPAQPEKLYTKADYIMALHKEYGCSLTRAEEAHNKALEYLRDEMMMKGGKNEI